MPGLSLRGGAGRALVLSFVLAIATGACGSSAATTIPPDLGNCDHWCGTASANVSFYGATATITGGGCYDQGAQGIDVRIGDWQGLNGLSDYLMLVGWAPGGPTPGPTPTDQPAPDQTDVPVSTDVTGAINGTPFTLGPDAVVKFTSPTSGTFTGTDVNGYGTASGTFICS